MKVCEYDVFDVENKIISVQNLSKSSGMKWLQVILAALVCLVIHCLVAGKSHSTQITAVNYKEGKDVSMCLQGGLGVPCRTMEWIANNSARGVYDLSNSAIVIQREGAILESAVMLTASNLTVIGEEQNGRIYCNVKSPQEGAGISFENCNNLRLHNLSFIHCGAYQNICIDTQNVTKRKVAVSIRNSSSVDLHNVTFLSNSGLGLAFFNTNGKVNMTYTTFNENRLDSFECSNASGGGGLLVDFAVCRECDSQEFEAEYTLQACNFNQNNNCINAFDRIPFLKNKHVQFNVDGRGGGVSVMFRGMAANKKISVLNSQFFRNGAQWGGAMAVAFEESAHNNSVEVRASSFSGNDAFSGGGIDILYNGNSTNDSEGNCVTLENLLIYQNTAFVGAGINIGIVPVVPNRPENGKLTVENCHFTENHSAGQGGGTAIYSFLSDVYTQEGAVLLFKNCSWMKNSALYGSAIDISPDVWENRISGFQVIPLFSECKFVSNYLLKLKAIKNGVFTVTSSIVGFEKYVVFKNNSGSALYIVSSIILFNEGTFALFTENSGINGGAIAIYGISYIKVKDNTDLHFINNSASNNGGALYFSTIDQRDFETSYSCFIQYIGENNLSRRNVTILFIHNKAQYSHGHGSSMYVTSLYACFYGCFPKTSDRSKKSLLDSFECVGNVSFTNSSIATIPTKMWPSMNTIKAAPGQTIKLPLNITDDLNNTAYPVVKLSIPDEGSVSVDYRYTYSMSRYAIFYGKPQQSPSTLAVQTIDFRQGGVNFSISLQNCPPGFLLEENERGKLQCTCGDETSHSFRYEGIEGCDKSTFRAKIRKAVWAGYIDTENTSHLCSDVVPAPHNLFIAHCPFRFCSHNYTQKLAYTIDLPDNNSCEALDLLMCGKERTGVLCSRCQQNSSVHYHSSNYRCGPNYLCSFGILFYVVTELLPLTVLFLLIMTFNLSFTSGALNGFVFCCQVLSVLSDALDDVSNISQTQLTATAIKIYQFFNFEFISLPFCLWENANILHIFGMKYVTVSFAFVLTIAFTALIKWCKCSHFHRLKRRYRIEDSVIHGINALSVLCYSQCTKISFQILTPTTLRSLNSSINHVSLLTAQPFMEGEHLYFTIIAIITILTIVLLPPVILLAYPLHYKCIAVLQINVRFSPLVKLKPLFDSFQGCFKDEFRFFAGLYFVYRILIFAAYVCFENLIIFHSVLEVLLLLIAALHSIAQPYQRRWHNVLDMLLFTVLISINGIILFTVYLTSTNAKGVAPFRILQSIFILLPLVYIAVYTIARVVITVVQPLVQRWRKKEYEEIPVLRHSEKIQ